tara:strand:+ start:201 stop:743 length:543 start_codon:yes stop_codon:yes gene_type:complete
MELNFRNSVQENAKQSEGEALVRELQKTKVSIDERLAGADIRVFGGDKDISLRNRESSLYANGIKDGNEGEEENSAGRSSNRVRRRVGAAVDLHGNDGDDDGEEEDDEESEDEEGEYDDEEEGNGYIVVSVALVRQVVEEIPSFTNNVCIGGRRIECAMEGEAQHWWRQGKHLLSVFENL